MNSKIFLITFLSIFASAHLCYSKNLTNKTNQLISKINDQFSKELLLVDKLQCCIHENEKNHLMNSLKNEIKAKSYYVFFCFNYEAQQINTAIAVCIRLIKKLKIEITEKSSNFQKNERRFYSIVSLEKLIQKLAFLNDKIYWRFMFEKLMKDMLNRLHKQGMQTVVGASYWIPVERQCFYYDGDCYEECDYSEEDFFYYEGN